MEFVLFGLKYKEKRWLLKWIFDRSPFAMAKTKAEKPATKGWASEAELQHVSETLQEHKAFNRQNRLKTKLNK